MFEVGQKVKNKHTDEESTIVKIEWVSFIQVVELELGDRWNEDLLNKHFDVIE